MRLADAVYDILSRAVIEIRKNAFDLDRNDKDKTVGWTPIQFWAVMKELATHDSVGVLSVEFEFGHRVVLQRRYSLTTDLKLFSMFFFFVCVLPKVNFDELKIHPLFKNDEAPFSAMEQAELVTISHRNGNVYDASFLQSNKKFEHGGEGGGHKD